jgi:hypothetical protein
MYKKIKLWLLYENHMNHMVSIVSLSFLYWHTVAHAKQTLPVCNADNKATKHASNTDPS